MRVSYEAAGGDAPPSVFEVGGRGPTQPVHHSTVERTAAAAAPPTSCRCCDTPTLDGVGGTRSGSEIPLHGVRASLGEQVHPVDARTPRRLRSRPWPKPRGGRVRYLKPSPPWREPAVGIDVAPSRKPEAARRRALGPDLRVRGEVRDDAPDVGRESAALRRAPRRRRARGRGDSPLSNLVINHSRRRAAARGRPQADHGQFSLQKTGSLDATAREKLLTMIRAHAEGYGQTSRPCGGNCFRSRGDAGGGGPARRPSRRTPNSRAPPRGCCDSVTRTTKPSLRLRPFGRGADARRRQVCAFLGFARRGRDVSAGDFAGTGERVFHGE